MLAQAIKYTDLTSLKGNLYFFFLRTFDAWCTNKAYAYGHSTNKSHKTLHHESIKLKNSYDLHSIRHSSPYFFGAIKEK